MLLETFHSLKASFGAEERHQIGGNLFDDHDSRELLTLYLLESTVSNRTAREAKSPPHTSSMYLYLK